MSTVLRGFQLIQGIGEWERPEAIAKPPRLLKKFLLETFTFSSSLDIFLLGSISSFVLWPFITINNIPFEPTLIMRNF